MWILIHIGRNDYRRNVCVSKTKKSLEEMVKEEGFYYSKKCRRYIDDKNTGYYGGSGAGDYLIEKIDIL